MINWIEIRKLPNLIWRIEEQGKYYQVYEDSLRFTSTAKLKQMKI